MKKADIVIGEEYAVGREDYPQRARVVEFGTYKNTTYPSYSFRGVTNEVRGVKVEELKADDTVYQTKWVPFQQVRMLWSVWLEAKANRDAYNRRVEKARSDTYAKQCELQKLLTGSEYGSGSVKVELTIAQADRLMALIRHSMAPSQNSLFHN